MLKTFEEHRNVLTRVQIAGLYCEDHDVFAFPECRSNLPPSLSVKPVVYKFELDQVYVLLDLFGEARCDCNVQFGIHRNRGLRVNLRLLLFFNLFALFIFHLGQFTIFFNVVAD